MFHENNYLRIDIYAIAALSSAEMFIACCANFKPKKINFASLASTEKLCDNIIKALEKSPIICRDMIFEPSKNAIDYVILETKINKIRTIIEHHKINAGIIRYLLPLLELKKLSKLDKDAPKLNNCVIHVILKMLLEQDNLNQKGAAGLVSKINNLFNREFITVGTAKSTDDNLSLSKF